MGTIALLRLDTMILDIARHKFYEGIITLLITTIVMIILLATSAGDSGIASAPDSPLMSLISSAAFGSGFVEGLITVILYIVSTLTLSRSTLRTHIYTADTMAPIALCSVMLLPMITTGDALHQAVVVLLLAHAMANMFYCFSHRKCFHRLFAAMVAAGTLAVVDASLTIVPVTMALALIAARKKLREAVAVVVGMLLPLFAYCYIAWLQDVSFSESLLLWWRSLVAPLSLNILDNLKLTRLIFIAFIVFLQATSVILHLSHREIHSSVMRGSWRTMQLMFVASLCCALLLPSASDSLLTVVVMIASAMLSMYFINSSAMLSVVSYVALASLAFAAAI